MRAPLDIFVRSGFVPGRCDDVGDPLSVVVFDRLRLRKSPQRGVQLVGTWDALVQALSQRPLVAEHKGAAGGFVLANLRDGIRRSQNVRTVSALAFDHDAGKVGLAQVHALLARYDHLVYSTASHEDARPRWRAILRLSRAITRDEHARLEAHARALLVASGIRVDACSADGCRLWYTPTIRPGYPFEARVGSGLPLDVGAVAVATDRRRSCAEVTSPTRSAARASAYVDAALRAAASNVARAARGSRNATLNREAYGIARLPVDALRIENLLLDAARAAGLSRSESVRTIQSALNARRGRT